MRAIRAAVVIGTLGSLAAGCGGGGSSGSGATAAALSSSATTSSGSAAGTGSGSIASGSSSTAPGATPGPTPTPSGPDNDPPALALTAPIRGLFTTQSQLLVDGTCTDQSGVAWLLVNGLPVLPDPVTGRFTQLVSLSGGLNVIELEASDPLGHRVKSAVPVVSGQYRPEASPITEALAARLNRPAFDALERVIAPQLAGPALTQAILAQNPLYSGNAALATIQVDATAVSLGTPTVDLDPRQGGLGVHAELPNVDVTTRAHGAVIGIGYSVSVNVTVTKAVLDATAVVNVAPGGVVTTTLQNVNVDLQGFRFDVGGIPTVLENLARNAVRGFLERQIEQQVARIVPTEVNRAIAGANGPITQTILGRQVTLSLIPTRVAFDPDGASVLTDGDLVVTPAPGTILPSLPTTPGSLMTPGTAPSHGTSPAALLSLNDDMLNRMAHAAWRGGMMSLKIDQAQAQAWGLPAWLPMDAFLLQLFFPSLVGVVNPSDPLELEVSTLTPVLFHTLPAPGVLDAAVGDLSLSVYVVPAGQPRQLVLQVATQVDVGMGVSVSPQNAVQLQVTGRPLIKTDVTAMPLGFLDPLAVENFVDFVLPPVIQLLPRFWSGFPLPTHPAIQLRNLAAERDGPGQDWVTVKGDL